MSESFLTIMDFVEAELVEKHSRFLGHMCHTIDKEQSEKFISKIKSEYKDASHNVSAYTIYDTGIMYCSDDGEPQGTAGRPVLEVLKREKIFNVCVVITRYFGGVLLGTGGLARAYSDTCKLLIKNANFANCKICDFLTVIVDYSDLSKVERIIEDFEVRILRKDFADKVSVNLLIETEQLDALKNALTNATAAKAEIKINESNWERIPIIKK